MHNGSTSYLFNFQVLGIVENNIRAEILGWKKYNELENCDLNQIIEGNYTSNGNHFKCKISLSEYNMKGQFGGIVQDLLVFGRGNFKNEWRNFLNLRSKLN